MTLIRETAIKAASRAGEILKTRLGNIAQVDYKSAFNIVTDVDKASEQEIIRIIRQSFPDHQILGEESGLHSSNSSCRWLIDPLDGTTNYAHSYPFFCVSIGFEENGKISFGLVFNPISNERFLAEAGTGAWLWEKRIHVSKTKDLSESLLATGFPPDTKTAKYSNLHEFTRLTDLCHGVRRDGSAALDLCYVASGRLDGFWEFKLSPWDLAAGCLIVEEAGGTISSLTGTAFDLTSGHVLATNGLIHKDLVQSLQMQAL